MMKIITVFECRDNGLNLYFANLSDVEEWESVKGYTIKPIKHFAIEIDGEMLLLKSRNPIQLWSEELELEHKINQKRKAALDKLTLEEQIILGLRLS